MHLSILISVDKWPKEGGGDSVDNPFFPRARVYYETHQLLGGFCKVCIYTFIYSIIHILYIYIFYLILFIILLQVMTTYKTRQ